MNDEQGRLDDGELVNDRYEILYLIGLGELGEVYETSDRHTSQDVVLKLFLPQVLDQPGGWEAYQEYCARIRALAYPTLVTPHEFAIHPSTASPFAISAKVPVPALDQLVATVGNLLPAHFARILKALAPVLDALHSQGLVHRNLKPSNIFCALQDPNSVRLTDFEVSQLRARVPPYPGWGATPGWVAPEAVDPHAASVPGSDIYALGLVGFFAITGRLPYLGLDPFEPNAFVKELNEPIPAASQRAEELKVRLDPKLDGWFARALAPAAQERFGSVLEMADALMQLTAVAPPLVTEGRLPSPREAAGVPGLAMPSMPPIVSMPPLSTDPGVAAASVQPLVFNADLASRPAPRTPNPADKLPARAGEIAPTQQRSNKLGLVLGAAAGFLTLAGLASAAAYLFLARPETEAANAAPSAATDSADVAADAPAQSVAPEPAPPPSAAPVPTVGEVEFRCKPKDCTSIECDNAPEATTGPITLEPGQHVCRVQSEGYEEKVATVTIEAGKALKRDVLLTEQTKTEPSPAPEKRAPAPAKTATATKKTAAKKTSSQKTATQKSSKNTRSTKTAPTKTKPCGTFIPCK